MDCLQFCCDKPETCDRVCRNHPDYVDRVREIGGFALDDVPRAPHLRAPDLPPLVPIIFHRNRRTSPLASSYAALSLYRMFDRRSGEPRYLDPEALRSAFGLARDAVIVLTGTDFDPPLERWWGLGGQRRRENIRAMRGAGVGLVTTPNYSLILDRPRWDDLHAMKRIALVHEEFLSEGMPAALHVNSRTDTDFRRWGDFLAARPEITHIAYEFTTGTARRSRQHAAWLAKLSDHAGRPLHLVTRGGIDVRPVLMAAYRDVSVLDTSIFMKTMKRQRAIRNGNGRPVWQRSPTDEGAPLDALLAHNLRIVCGWFADVASASDTSNVAAA